MPSDIIEPPFEGPGPAPHEPLAERHAPREKAPPSTTSTSGDDLSLSLTHAPPDPMLGEFLAGSASPSHELGGHAPPDHEPERADVFNAIAALDLGAEAPPVTPTDPLAGIHLHSTTQPKAHEPDPRHHAPHPQPAAGKADDEEKVPDEDDDEDDEPRGVTWTTLLLASYASAVTIGLIWVLWTGRRVREDIGEILPAADARPDPGERASKSRRLIPPPPIAADHLARLGATVLLGHIEATPLEIKPGSVRLERDFNGKERKPGGDNALLLRLRLKNVSTDLLLAPFDEAFVRDRPEADPDSFIETGEGLPAIAMFPLAVESEWSIPGQQFRLLKPGESLETLVVSVPDAVAKMTPEMTWRIRLRTDINHTEDLGVRFGRDDVKTK
jgi:hypothetical protein